MSPSETIEVAICEGLAPELATKWRSLLTLLLDVRSAAVAFSGGVDSALLSVAAYSVLGEQMIAVTFRSVVEPPGDSLAASALAEQFVLPHRIIDFDDLAQPAFVSNPPDRCYYCKRKRFDALLVLAKGEGFECVLDGSNLDDAGEYRPGRRALTELGVRSPLEEAGLGKAEIRTLARALRIPVWDRPSSPCLATRFPYGASLSSEGFQRVAAAEAFLHKRGYRSVRVRDYGSLASIEVDPEMIGQLASERQKVSEKLSGLGYRHITLDLVGYRSGSMDETLNL